jgi:alginate O-acetyltransferase complex protein AlgI
MVFPSVTFLFFFLPPFLASYFLVPGVRWKNIVTLGWSLLFYAWSDPDALPVLLGSVALNFYAAIAIDSRDGSARRTALLVAVGINLLVLVVFKYTGFLAGIIGAVTRPLGLTVPAPRIALPLGISFFTFHCISYITDVYRRRFRANRNLKEVALYITLFPQLVAGPIVRYKTVAKQLHGRQHSLRLAETGTRMFIIGLAQKVLIADAVAPLAHAVFDDLAHPSLADAWLGLLGYTLQIYFDFCGYSNMAIGLGLIIGFSLPRNFRLPYASLSVREFWQRWHMSLSSWLRDYLYIPLGGSRGGPRETYRNLMTVFLLCGMWHGASWNFLLWGVWHGTFLIAERLVPRGSVQAPAILRWLYAMLAVMGGWVLFRASDLPRAGTLYASLLGLNGLHDVSIDVHLILQPTLVLPMLAGIVLAVAPRWVNRRMLPSGMLRSGIAQPAADALVFGLLAVALLQVASGTYSPFLYFRF